jgi:hypothetical protein
MKAAVTVLRKAGAAQWKSTEGGGGGKGEGPGLLGPMTRCDKAVNHHSSRPGRALGGQLWAVSRECATRSAYVIKKGGAVPEANTIYESW